MIREPATPIDALRELNANTRRRLRFHGWLLTLWCVFLGIATSWFLLRVMHLRAPAARYAISAVVMYALGLLVGTRVWLTHFAASVREEAGTLGPADAVDRAMYDEMRLAETGAKSRGTRARDKITGGFDWLDFAGNFDFGELSAFILVPGLILLGIGLLLALGGVPVVMVDGLAGLLAEMAVQFIFGALIARRTMRVRNDGDPFLHVVGKTWIAGFLLVVVSAAAGWLLVRMDPGAASIGDLFHHGATP